MQQVFLQALTAKAIEIRAADIGTCIINTVFLLLIPSLVYHYIMPLPCTLPSLKYLEIPYKVFLKRGLLIGNFKVLLRRGG